MLPSQTIKAMGSAPTWSAQPQQQMFAKADDPKDDDPDDDDPDDDDDDDDPEGGKDDDDKSKPKARPKGKSTSDWRREARQATRELNRQKTANATTKAAMTKALGLSSSDADDLTPAQLQEKFDRHEKDKVEAKIENSILRKTRKIDADLTDSRKFMREALELDPSDKDFDDDLQELIDTEVKRLGLDEDGGGDDGNDDAKGKPAAKRRRSGTPKGDDGAPKQWTLADLQKASPEAIVKAREEGKLAKIQGG